MLLTGPAFWTAKSNPLGKYPSQLLLHFDGTNGSTSFPDSSANAVAMSIAAGSPSITTAVAHAGFGQCLYAATTGAVRLYGVLPASSATKWFIDMWVYRTGTASYAGLAYWGAGNAGILLKASADGGGYQVWLSRSSVFLTGVTAIPLNTWTHVLVSQDYNGASAYNTQIYINGVLDAQTGYVTNALGVPTGAFEIGRHDNAGFSGLPADLDEYHIVVGHSITSNFTPPTSPYTI